VIDARERQRKAESFGVRANAEIQDAVGEMPRRRPKRARSVARSSAAPLGARRGACCAEKNILISRRVARRGGDGRSVISPHEGVAGG
jgi:hypothetical protein